jgi:hypothetical protein
VLHPTPTPGLPTDKGDIGSYAGRYKQGDICRAAVCSPGHKGGMQGEVPYGRGRYRMQGEVPYAQCRALYDYVEGLLLLLPRSSGPL